MVKARITKKTEYSNIEVLPNLKVTWNGKSVITLNYLPSIPKSFLISASSALSFVVESYSYSYAKQLGKYCYKFLCYLEDSDSNDAILIKSLLKTNPSFISAETANSFEKEYLNGLKEKYKVGSQSLNNAISLSNKAIALLSSRDLWPQTLRLKLIKVNRDFCDVRASLLESIGSDSKKISGLKGVDRRSKAAYKGLERLSIPVNQNDSNHYLSLLKGEQLCIDKIYDEARNIFDAWYLEWKSIQHDLNEYKKNIDYEMAEWLEDFKNSERDSGRSNVIESLATKIFKNDEKGLIRFLFLIESSYMNGDDSYFFSMPSEQYLYCTQKIRNIFRRLEPVLSALDLPTDSLVEKVRGLMTPNAEIVGAVAIMLMMETGMNVSPLISIKWSNINKTDDPRWISIESRKMRASGSIVREELYVSKKDEKTSAGAALLKLKEMSIKHKSLIGNETIDIDNVFLFSVGHLRNIFTPDLKLLTGSLYASFFKKIALLAFGDFPVPVPSCVRPSILLCRKHKNNSLLEAQIAANHKNPETTFSHYVGNNRASSYERDIYEIRVFQERFESIAIHNLKG